MKINRIQLGEALVRATLDQLKNTPAENEIHYTFSRNFEANIRDMDKKSKSVTWRVWQTPVKRAVLIAVLIMVMLITVACATPVIRNAIIDFIFVDGETAYGITFDPCEATNAPCMIEDIYVPTFEPKGYILSSKEHTSAKVEYLWKNEHGEYINYRQSLVPESASDSTWTVIDAEGTRRTTKNINGYLVEIISNKVDQQFVAMWTDNCYFYVVNVSVIASDSEFILEAVINSLTEVKTIE